jgi:DNA (cytosine-5)-methyltransferase 1
VTWCSGCRLGKHDDRRPRLLDLYCCGGGAAVGYHQAGFCVTGVDIAPQPRYPFSFIKYDAIKYLRGFGHLYDAAHASPPCQAYSPLNAYNHHDYPELISATRQGFEDADLPFVIENVEAAKSELRDPLMLCGPMFGLKVYRHRLFETNFTVPTIKHGRHVERCVRNGYLPTAETPFMSIHGGKHSKAWQSAASKALELPHLDWNVSGADTKTAIREICEAIPWRMTWYIGKSLRRMTE